MSILGISEVIIKDITKDKIIEILQKTYKIIGIIIDSNHEDIKKKVNELDLKARLEEIEGLFIDIEKIGKLQDKQSIKSSINSLHEIVNKIHLNLDTASTKIIEYNSSWFTFWKSVNLGDEIKDLEINEKILTIRYNRVKDLLKIIW